MKRLLVITVIIYLSICSLTILKSCRKITEPEVTTNPVTDITSTSVTSGGNVKNNGGDEVIARGVCWSTSKSPVFGSNSTSNGTGNGIFTSNISGLAPNTQYHVRAYATNSKGIGYGDDIEFTTICESPSSPVIGAITQPTCGAITGSVVLNGLPSSGSWTLTRSPGGTTTSGTGSSTTISDLTAGATYTFTVTNSSGCVSSASANVAINAKPDTPSAPVVGTITQPSCSAATGSVVLSGLPSTGTWTLTRTPGGTTINGTGASTTISALPAGVTYTFTVTNASGCVSTASGNALIEAQPAAPSATTNGATNINSTSATLNGTVNANGASTIVTFSYGKSASYGSTITASQSPISGKSATNVNATLTGLTPNTEYHYQVNAGNCKGSKSGSDELFTTSSGCSDSFESNNTIATANTTAFSTLGSENYSNTINGTIDISSDVDFYRLYVTTPGIITITSYSPGADRDLTLLDANGLTIDFSVHGFRELILYPITTAGYYYVKVWGGVNSCLTYSLSINWGPGANTGTFTDYRDERQYKWVYIGTQFWMAENLNVGTRINGSLEQTANGVIEKYCYNDTESNCNLYGGLYQWNEMMQYTEYEETRGICPEGWHIPSDDEWKTLEMSLGMGQAAADATGWRGSDEGGKLKAVSNLWSGDNVGATNSSRFTALPSGDRKSGGAFESLGFFTDFWTSTINSETGSIWYHLLDTEHATIYRTRGDRKYGTPLRCIKD